MGPSPGVTGGCSLGGGEFSTADTQLPIVFPTKCCILTSFPETMLREKKFACLEQELADVPTGMLKLHLQLECPILIDSFTLTWVK